MQINVEIWQLITGMCSMIAAFTTVVWVLGKVMVGQFNQQLSDRLLVIHGEISAHIKDEEVLAKQMRDFEREFLTFQRDMPVLYVRREDYIRGQTVIESKLDALYSKLEVVQIQGARHD